MNNQQQPDGDLPKLQKKKNKNKNKKQITTLQLLQKKKQAEGRQASNQTKQQSLQSMATIFKMPSGRRVQSEFNVVKLACKMLDRDSEDAMTQSDINRIKTVDAYKATNNPNQNQKAALRMMTHQVIKKMSSFTGSNYTGSNGGDSKDTVIINAGKIIDIFKKNNGYGQNFLNLKIQRTDVACIIYTSGTQGKPKGVMLSHGGILNNSEGAYRLLENFISKKPKFLTWLPLSHSYEHTVQFVQIAVGARIFYAESIDKLIKNMNDCSPEIMTAVPRFYQNLYQKIIATFEKTKGVKKLLINQTIYLGKKKLNKQEFSIIEKCTNFICEKLVRKKIKNQFGSNLKAFISGGGALDKEVGSLLNAIGLPTLQGYGLTETSPVVSCNSIDDIRVETVGQPFKGNLVKIADDGEILVKGENVMLGYWRNEEETNKVLKNGWLSTGDIGEFVDGFLKITDRKKDIIITPGGDNISPVKIENDLNKSTFIEQSLVYGDNKPYLVALIVLSPEHKNTTEEKIQQEIEKTNKNLSKIEKIKKIFIIKKQFTIENSMMTPTLKLKRYKIINIYKDELEKLF